MLFPIFKFLGDLSVLVEVRTEDLYDWDCGTPTGKDKVGFVGITKRGKTYDYDPMSIQFHVGPMFFMRKKKEIRGRSEKDREKVDESFKIPFSVPWSNSLQTKLITGEKKKKKILRRT